MVYRLVDANITKKDEPITEVKDLLLTLKSAWVEISGDEKVVQQQQQVKPSAGLNLQG